MIMIIVFSILNLTGINCIKTAESVHCKTILLRQTFYHWNNPARFYIEININQIFDTRLENA